MRRTLALVGAILLLAAAAAPVAAWPGSGATAPAQATSTGDHRVTKVSTPDAAGGASAVPAVLDVIGYRDQSQYMYTEMQRFQPTAASANYNGLAQTVVAGKAGWLTFVSLYLDREGWTTKDLVLEIHANTPAGALLATSDPVPAASIPVNPNSGWVDFTFSSPATFAVGDTFAIVTRYLPASPTSDPAWYAAAGGTGYAKGSRWGCSIFSGCEPYVDGSDLVFETYVTSAPGAPRNVIAAAGDVSATVSWTAPASNGGSAITGYTVIASDNVHTCTWASGQLGCTVTGLTNGTAYTFKVTATNAVGTGPASAASTSVVPIPGATYTAVDPTRLLDTRTGNGLSDVFQANVGRTFLVAGRAPVPAGAIAVTGNLTVTQQTASGYLFVGPVKTNAPTSSTLNFPLGDNRANAVTVALGAGGTLSVTYVAKAGAHAQVIFDVTGYFTP